MPGAFPFHHPHPAAGCNGVGRTKDQINGLGQESKVKDQGTKDWRLIPHLIDLHLHCFCKKAKSDSEKVHKSQRASDGKTFDEML